MKAILNFDIHQFKSNPFYITFFIIMMLCSIAVFIAQAVELSMNQSLDSLGPSLYVLFITTYVFIALPLIGMKKNERSNYHLLLFSMPIRRKTIVTTKFYEILGLFGFTSVIGILSYIIVSLFNNSFHAPSLLTFVVVPIISIGLLGALYMTVFITSKHYYFIIPAIYFITLLSFSISGFLDVTWIVPNSGVVILICLVLIVVMYAFSLTKIERKEF